MMWGSGKGMWGGGADFRKGAGCRGFSLTVGTSCTLWRGRSLWEERVSAQEARSLPGGEGTLMPQPPISSLSPRAWDHESSNRGTLEWGRGSTTLCFGLKVGWYFGEFLGTEHVHPISDPGLLRDSSHPRGG